MPILQLTCLVSDVKTEKFTPTLAKPGVAKVGVNFSVLTSETRQVNCKIGI